MSIEAGGNAPFIVFDDADIDAAVDGAIVSKFRQSGQTCVCTNRLYVQSGVYADFASKLAEKVDKFKARLAFTINYWTGQLMTSDRLEMAWTRTRECACC